MPLLTRSRGRQRFFNQPFSPSQLFLGGIQGAWYDPSDNATMFQDAAGLTPVTAVEQPVGLVFDKRLGPTARRNLLTYSEQFDNAAWFKEGGAISADSTLSPDGTTTADTWTASATNNRHAMLGGSGSGFPSVANADYVFSAYVKKGTHNYVSLLVTNNLTTWFVATFDLSGATPVMSQSGAGAGGTFVSSSVESAANGFWRLSIRGRKTDAVVVPEIAISPSATPTYGNYGETNWAAAGTETIVIWGAQLEAASTASTYQKITSGIGGEWTPGNHAYQSTAASRPVLRARYNLLTYSEQFDNAAWILSQLSVSANSQTAPDGTVSGDTLVESAVAAWHGIYQSPLTLSGTHSFSIYVKGKDVSRWAYYKFYVNTNDWIAVVVNPFTGVVTQSSSGALSGFSSVTTTSTPAPNGWFRIVTTFTRAGGAPVYIAPGPVDSATPSLDTNGNLSYTGDGVSGFYAWGAQLLTAADAAATGNAYQRIEGAATYAIGGVFRPYLAFDGVDDALATNAVDFTATDKMSIFAGCTKTSDPNYQTIVSNGASTVDVRRFALFSTYNSNAKYSYQLSGTSTATIGIAETSSFFAAPSTDVITTQTSISTTPITSAWSIRVDGSTQATSVVGGFTYATSPTTFANAALSIGVRGDGFFNFTGRIYGLIVRGAASTNTEVSNAEQWLAGKTGLVFGSLFPLLLIGQLIFSSPANSGQILTLGL